VAQAEFQVGVLVGLLIGEGHFGGDGRQPQLTLRMHTRHRTMFEWLQTTFPGGRLYGPYLHGGRDYMQWMVRGAYLRDEVLPLIAPHIQAIDEHAWSRLQEMCTRYRIPLP
jgi:hypothetical protein